MRTLLCLFTYSGVFPPLPSSLNPALPITLSCVHVCSDQKFVYFLIHLSSVFVCVCVCVCLCVCGVCDVLLKKNETTSSTAFCHLCWRHVLK